jgi:hypothetical protein
MQEEPTMTEDGPLANLAGREKIEAQELIQRFRRLNQAFASMIEAQNLLTEQIRECTLRLRELGVNPFEVVD